jgi:serine/threonine protein kinase
MGVVYSAYDAVLDRKIALKLLRKGREHEQAQAARLRLLREAQAMARLSHPNVLTIHEVGTVEEQIFIAMEFVDGGTLRSWLDERPRPLQEVLQIFLQAGRGLQAAHAVGLVHRDFKPDEVVTERESFFSVPQRREVLANSRETRCGTIKVGSHVLTSTLHVRARGYPQTNRGEESISDGKSA